MRLAYPAFRSVLTEALKTANMSFRQKTLLRNLQDIFECYIPVVHNVNLCNVCYEYVNWMKYWCMFNKHIKNPCFVMSFSFPWFQDFEKDICELISDSCFYHVAIYPKLFMNFFLFSTSIFEILKSWELKTPTKTTFLNTIIYDTERYTTEYCHTWYMQLDCSMHLFLINHILYTLLSHRSKTIMLQWS